MRVIESARMGAFAAGGTLSECGFARCQDTDGQTPSERGPRRGPSVETLIPIRDHAIPGRLAVDARELDRS